MIKGNFERKTGVLLFYVEILHTRWFVLFRIINCVSEVGAGLFLRIYIRATTRDCPYIRIYEKAPLSLIHRLRGALYSFFGQVLYAQIFTYLFYFLFSSSIHSIVFFT